MNVLIRNVIGRLLREIDPTGVQDRMQRRLKRRAYYSRVRSFLSNTVYKSNIMMISLNSTVCFNHRDPITFGMQMDTISSHHMESVSMAALMGVYVL